MSTVFDSSYDRRALDAYWTRPWVTMQLLDALQVADSSLGEVVWEPACGKGLMARVLLELGYDVYATDVVDYGYDGQAGQVDFVSVKELPAGIKTIMTNPPYNVDEPPPGYRAVTAEQFVRKALWLMQPVKGRVLMLMRSNFSQASGRRDLFQMPVYDRKLELTARPRWKDEGEDRITDAGPKHDYAWFCWDFAKPPGERAFHVVLPVTP